MPREAAAPAAARRAAARPVGGRPGMPGRATVEGWPDVPGRVPVAGRPDVPGRVPVERRPGAVGALGGAPPPVLLVGHGSRDPRAAVSTGRLAASVAAARPGAPVAAAYLELAAPSVSEALARLAPAPGAAAPVVLPLLLTDAYHGRVDLPEQLSRAGYPVVRAPVLGPVPGGPGAGTARRLLVAALARRLAEAGGPGVLRGPGVPGVPGGPGVAGGVGGIVLAAPGTRVAAAREGVARVAAALGAALGLPCRVGWCTGAPTVADAVRDLSGRGAPVAVAAHFLAPGRLLDGAVRQARGAGAAVVAGPLGNAPEIVDLVLFRAGQSHCRQ